MGNETLTYYQQQAKDFEASVESVLKGIMEFLTQNEDQLNPQQKRELKAVTSLYMGAFVGDIQRDFSTYSGTMDTIEKRVELEVESAKIIKEVFPLDKIHSVFFDCLFSIYLEQFRRNLVWSMRRMEEEKQLVGGKMNY